jgi:acetoin utilization deacetylase AcuC-like enzyme
MSTALIYSDQFLLHNPGEHPERPQRYKATLSALMQDEDLWAELHKLEPRPATDAELLRCHEPETLKLVADSASYERVALDVDTVVSRDSGNVARLAAGGACRAIDEVMSGASTNAFVACRPPGHHATSTEVMGFCLFNNVAVAARYAQATYPDVRKVLIVDFDVHHGNGTQEIFYDDASVYYFSLHQYPWYPGTGAASERGAGAGEGLTLNVPIAGGTPAPDYFRSFERGIEIVARDFKPDLLLVSAGFDAHVADPLGQLKLTDDDYAKMTARLTELALVSCKGRLVACLEGGYNLETLGGTVRRHVSTLAVA